MVDEYKERFSSFIDSILSHLPKNADDLLRQFVAHYYAKMPLMDLEHIDPKRACTLAVNSFEHFKVKTSHLQIRIFKPNEEEHGWKSNHMVIEVHSDDMAFILDSLAAKLSHLGFRFYETIHPIIFVKRDKKGNAKQLIRIDETGELGSGVQAESFIHFQLSSLPDDMDEQQLIDTLTQILGAVRLVNQDWMKMADKTQDVARHIQQVNKYFDPDEVREAQDFLSWSCDKNFVFLGYIEYDFYDSEGNECLNVVKDSEMGLFRVPNTELKPQALSALPPEVLHFAKEHALVEVTKSNRKSTVHRPVLMDYISVKRFNDGGKVVGESRFLGLFTSTVYYQSADRIPFIRRKIAQTLRRANFDPTSHNGKQLTAVLEFYPRDELFQIAEDDLFEFCIGLISLEAKPAVRIFARKDRFERFMSCMVYAPRERFNTYIREQIAAILERAFSGKITAFYTTIGDTPLARVHLIVATEPGNIPDHNISDIEAEIAKITNRWADGLRNQLIQELGEEEGESLMGTYADAFPESYIQMNSSKDAVADIKRIQHVAAGNELAVDLFKRKKESERTFHLKIYTEESERLLSDMLPMLENLGCQVVEVNPYIITPKRKKKTDVLIRDFRLQVDDKQSLQLEDTSALLEEALAKIWTGEVENDAFNSLVLTAQLSWREILILRAYCQYMRQIGSPYSRFYVAEVLGKHPTATRNLIQAFFAKFSPEINSANDKAAYKMHLQAIYSYLNDVSNMAEDRIIRRFADLITATLRTNYFQRDAAENLKTYLSFKFRSGNIPEIPQPTPYAEIFVYSMKTEGIHLRGDKVARGGLRWSDRREDFRTEVLGLMKAQMVKNTVIVPQGSKGGFVVKHPPQTNDRDVIMASGIESYKEFLSGLLDITDNMVDGTVVPPNDVVRFDDDDPYLVVAADKGTATFSDIANNVAADYGFWLDDAFASGGSVGYDHKAMGITARGAWVSVERHFHEMGINISEEDFTVVGIGDMSGDVFGNGMLLSEHIRLLGAFNHKHIFLDPNPDAAASFQERKRLFETPRTQWTDYDETLISKGGGVFARDQKSIPLSKEVQSILGTEETKLAPDTVIKLLLKAEVDLLWNGGIGTYIKAVEESNENVGDRANNTVRVNGEDCRAKVIGEGGNLGCTQLGRIEYAKNGGRINTDAIDNSAGVDCSDHEVNIKIALSDVVSKGQLDTEGRNSLLERMTDEVSRLVLIDNRLQTQALTIAESHGFSQLEPLARMMRQLEKEGLLDREVEFLPNKKQLNELRIKKQGLTRPELAVLLSYSKLALYRDLKDSMMVENDYFIQDLMRYFPEEMQQYEKSILSHPLRGQIVATIVTNSIVNRAGITFAHSLIEGTGMHPCDVARSYVISRDAFGLRHLWADIEALTGAVHVDVQAEMFIEISHFLERTSLWFLHNVPEPIDIEKTMEDYCDGIQTFASCYESLMSKTLDKAFRSQIEYFTNKGVPEALARHVAGLEALSSACDVTHTSKQYGLDVEVVGRVYFEIGAQMRLGWLRRSAQHIVTEDYWDRLAIKSLVRELYLQQRRLTSIVVANLCKDTQCSFSVETWYEENQRELERYYTFIDDLKSHEVIDLSMLVVAVRNVESVCHKKD